MTTVGASVEEPGLGPGAAEIVRRAHEVAAESGDATLGVNHWLLAVVSRHGGMAESMSDGLSAATLRPWLHARLRADEAGAPLDEPAVVGAARDRAAAHGRPDVSESDVVATVLRAAGYVLREGPPPSGSVPAGGAASDAAGAAGGAASGTTTRGPEAAASDAPRDDGAADAGATTWTPRATRPTPTLDTFGRDLTAEAKAGRLPALIGREAEVSVVIETLCRSTKRNPALVGPAGTGKSAIVEGLAARIVGGDVPALLRGYRIVQLSPSALVAGAGVYGVLDERMRSILAEASQDGIALFIDELHSIVGAGGARGSGDIASLIKPALARGEIACIAATTDEEYRRYIEDDPALERRFAPVLVREPTVEQTVAIVRSHRDRLARLRGVTADDALLDRIVRFAGDAMPDRRYPDKAVELLEQVVAHAVAEGQTTASPGDVEAVGRRLTGLPTDVDERLAALADRLRAAGLLMSADLDAIVGRIGVGMRGADVRRERPNAVVLLAGEQSRAAAAIASITAEGLFGSPDRVVTIEAGRMTQGHDVAMLVGAPPGYVGYSDDLPIHAIDRMRACAVLVLDVDRAHRAVLDVLGRAFGSGTLADGAGRTIHLSETVVFLATAEAGAGAHPIGFVPPGTERPGDAPGHAADPRTLLGSLLGDEVDVVVAETPGRGSREAWIAESLLPEVTRRFLERGVDLAWDPAVAGNLAARGPAGTRGRTWERFLDEELGPVVAATIGKAGDAGRRPALRVAVREGALAVEEVMGGAERTTESARQPQDEPGPVERPVERVPEQRPSGEGRT